MRKSRFMLVAIFLLGVGFATVSTTLYLNGDVTIATNNVDFDVRFTKATPSTGATATISNNGKTITFETSDLATVGDISKVNFEVTNNSEMYDAEVSVACSTTGAKKDYYEITSTVKSPIVGKTTEKGNVQVKLLKATTTDIEEPFTCTLTATATERTTKAEKVKYVPKYFAIDDPTTSSTQDYTILQNPYYSYADQMHAEVFLGLDADGSQKSVCTLYTGNLECFKNNHVAEEQAHVKEVFGESNCSTNSDSDIECFGGNFACQIRIDGSVHCDNQAAGTFFGVNSDGSVYYCG